MTVISSPADAADLPSAADAGEWDRAVAALASAGEVCLACHVNPDGDALGSMLACAQALRARADASQRVPSILRFLPGLDLLTAPRDYPAEPEVMITFDAASRDRLGMLAGNSARARELIVIDHHASNTRFGTINLVDPAAAATAVLACGLIDRLGVPLTAHVALGLYTGLVTDTGSFRYAATSRAVHLLAARLLAVGVEPEAVSRELWDRASFGYLRVLSAALGRATLEPREAGGRGLVWTTVPMADRAAHGVGYDALEPVIDVLRRTEEAEVAVVFKQDDDGVWQASARSKGNVDVAAAAAALGGGGHPAAAGFTSNEPVYDALGRLRELLRSGEAGAPGGSGGPSPRAGTAGGSGGPPPGQAPRTRQGDR